MNPNNPYTDVKFGNDEIPTCLKYFTKEQWKENFIFLITYVEMDGKKHPEVWIINGTTARKPEKYKWYEDYFTKGLPPTEGE